MTGLTIAISTINFCLAFIVVWCVFRIRRSVNDVKETAAQSQRSREAAFQQLAFEHLDLAEAWDELGDAERAEAHKKAARILAGDDE